MTDKRSFLKLGFASLIPAAFVDRLQAQSAPLPNSGLEKIVAIQEAKIQSLLKNAHKYEEGVWTPALFRSSNLSVPTPIQFDEATYTRIGNTVFARIGRFLGINQGGPGGATELIISSTGLPGVTHATEFSGQAYVYSGGLPTNAIIVKNSYSSSDIYIGWPSSGPGGPITCSGIAFSYKV